MADAPGNDPATLLHWAGKLEAEADAVRDRWPAASDHEHSRRAGYVEALRHFAKRMRDAAVETKDG